MVDVPDFAARAPIGCCYRSESRDNAVCGLQAGWTRYGVADHFPRYFCAKHRASKDVPISGAPLVRRVSVTLEVVLTGVSFLPAIAHAEAVRRLELAVASAGGVINLHAVRSVVGRYAGQAPAGAQSSPAPLLP